YVPRYRRKIPLMVLLCPKDNLPILLVSFMGTFSNVFSYPFDFMHPCFLIQVISSNYIIDTVILSEKAYCLSLWSKYPSAGISRTIKRRR
ncbi:MAG: hypothetical protein WBQ16_06680, partial [Nitrososphaeraceae archaeon]